MELTLDSLPLPSLFCLITIGFFPFIARQTHSIWRAIQAYDSQIQGDDVGASGRGKGKASKKREWTVSITLILFFVGFFFSSGKQWQKDFPAIAAMRNCLPEVVFMAFVPLTIISALTYFLFPWPTAISRQAAFVKKQEDYVTSKHLIRSYKSTTQLFQVRLLFVTVIFAFLWMLQVSGMKYTIPLMASAGLIFFMQACHVPVFVNNVVTFRMLCLIPLVILASGVAMMTVLTAIIYAILTIAPEVFHETAPSKSSNGSPLDQVFFDLGTNQMMSLAYPFLWCFTMYSPLLLVGLAYRFDMTRAGLSLLTKEEKEAILAESNQTKDKSGRSPVLLHTAAVPKSMLSNIATPTYKTALYTALITQAVGVIVEYSVGWTGYSPMPTNSSEVQPLQRTDVLSLWPILAFPLMLIAMLIRARMESKQSIVDLWTYREDWCRPDSSQSTLEAIVETEKDTIA